MDFEFNETQRLIRETAADIAKRHIAPVARQNDIEERFPADIVKKMAAMGMLGGTIPEEYGGAGLDYICYSLLIEEVGKVCGAFRTVLSVQLSLVAPTIL